MRQKLLTRLGALLAAGVLMLGWAAVPAQAYSGSQAEAQMDPSNDPYSFPNIQLCCKPKKKVSRPHRPWYGPNGPGPGPGGPGGPVQYVSCGEPRPYTSSSIGEALDRLRNGGRIRVLPYGACDISGLSIDESVVIESAEEYGGRAELRSGSCATVAPGYGSSVVGFSNIDIDGCLVVQNGRLDFNRVNLASRGAGDAVRLNGGSFSSTESTIRARGPAINAVRGTMVSLTGGGFASGARAEQVIALNVDGANLQNTLVKGGLVGVRVGMSGRYPVVFNRVQVTRGEAAEIYQIGPGQAGIVVGGNAPGDDLPSLPSLPGVSFSIEGGVIAGFVDGLVFAPGSRGSAKGVNIAYPGRGIVVGAGAAVDLRENRITKSKRVGIDLAAGASGQASFNDIQCDDGRCVCYGGDCTSRSDRDFGNGAFRMSGTRCDD